MPTPHFYTFLQRINLAAILLGVSLLLSEHQRPVATASLATGSNIEATSGAQTPPTVAGCPVFPNDNIWNTPVNTLPVDPNSDAYINTIGANTNVHPDFGSGLWNGGPIGIPYVDVSGSQPGVSVSFRYDDESDPGPYPNSPRCAH